MTTTRRAPAPSPYVYRRTDGYRLTQAGYDYLRASWLNPKISLVMISIEMNISANSARMLAVRVGLGRKAICFPNRGKKPEQEDITGWFEDHESAPPPGSRANAIKAAQRYAP